MSESEKASEEFSASSELSAYINNFTRLENDDLPVHTGKIPNGSDMDFMNFVATHYKPQNPDMPYHYEDTEFAKAFIKQKGAEVATKAIQEGNISQMKFFSGRQDYSADLSGIHALRWLRNELEEDAYIQYLFGHMGNGKTDWAILQGEVAGIDLGYEIGTNIKSLKEKDEYLYTYGDLLNWLAEGRDIDNIDKIANSDISVSDKMFIFDEASSHATGYSKDASETQEKLGTLVKKMRKVGANMIIIGHTGKDVHPDIRRITNHCTHKSDLKKCIYYHDVNDDGKGKGKVKELGAIPKTNWNSYDTNEVTLWDWSTKTREELGQTAEKLEEKKNMETEERNMQIVTASVDNEHPDIEPNEKGKITQQMLADYYGLSRGRVSQIISEFSEEMEGVV